jgi:hypothetical protein
MVTNLVTRFADAGLDLRLADSPFARGVGTADIFQLDIRRARKNDARTEYFIAWMGAGDNSAFVAGVDERKRQVVLTVREAHREFEEQVPQHLVRQARATGDPAWQNRLASRVGVRSDLLVVRGDAAYLRRETKGATRHFLAGRDERQLFMCQLPQPCTTVADAHSALRPPRLKMSRSAVDRPIRQGEWFFVVIGKPELEELERAIAGNRAVVRRNTGINSFIPRAGKPHVAEEIVAIVKSPTDIQVYVRGTVRHPDHEKIRIHGWRRVVKNREVVPVETRSPLGGTWID